MQKGYNEIQSVEIELRILEQTSAPPSRPREYLKCISTDDKPPETEMATVRIKKVRFVDEIWISLVMELHSKENFLSCKKNFFFLFIKLKNKIFSATHKH